MSIKWLVALLLLSQTAFSVTVCPKSQYKILSKWPSQVTKSFYIPKCYKKRFNLMECRTYQDDAFCIYGREGYELYTHSLSKFPKKVIHKGLWFGKNVPPKCKRTNVVAEYTAPTKGDAYFAKIKNQTHLFEFLTRKFDGSDEEDKFWKKRSFYQSRQNKKLFIVDTIVKAGNDKKRMRYMIGCRKK